jgi:tryptophan synthase beta chain
LGLELGDAFPSKQGSSGGFHDVEGSIEARAVDQIPTFEAAVQFTQSEGIIPAPETAHAVKVAIDEAIKCKEEGTSIVIAFNFSGHGLLDLAAYDAYIQVELENYAYPEQNIREAMKDFLRCRKLL